MPSDEAWRRVRLPDREIERVAAEVTQGLFGVASRPGALSIAADDRDSRAARLIGYGWWVRGVRTAEAIRILHVAGLAHEAAPLVRTLLHHALALE